MGRGRTASLVDTYSVVMAPFTALSWFFKGAMIYSLLVSSWKVGEWIAEQIMIP